MRSTIAHGKTRYQPNFSVHPDMDDEPNAGLYRPDRTFTSMGARYGADGWYAPAGVDLAAFRERVWL